MVDTGGSNNTSEFNLLGLHMQYPSIYSMYVLVGTVEKMSFYYELYMHVCACIHTNVWRQGACIEIMNMVSMDAFQMHVFIPILS